MSKFITFEGGEGTGKSTQITLLTQRLREAGIAVCQTREPGGCPTAETLRQVVLDAQAALQPISTLMLMLTARYEHVHHTILPALETGQWVVCDRFTDSSFAYQGAGLGVDSALIQHLTTTLHIPAPDLTFVLDMPAEVALQRRQARGGPVDRFEQQDLSFHQRIRQAFLERAHQDPTRYQVIDATGPIEKIAQQIWDQVQLSLLGADLQMSINGTR